VFVPEYSITTETLRNISNIEYARSIIENTVILPHWQKQLEKEAKIRIVKNSCNDSAETVKAYIDGLERTSRQEIKNMVEAFRLVEDFPITNELDETDLKKIHKVVSQNLLPPAKCGVYRSVQSLVKTHPEEILAKITELIDWYNSLDARQTHPILSAGILKSQIDNIEPFEKTNLPVANITTYLVLKMNGYAIKNFFCLEEYYALNKTGYKKACESVRQNHDDLTAWLEFFTEGFAHELLVLKEKILLLARDTKLAKVSGRIDLTTRQERIVEYLQDYGVLTNHTFALLFPNVSEDSILRDIKTLLSAGVIAKKGKTKSSRYELR